MSTSQRTIPDDLLVRCCELAAEIAKSDKRSCAQPVLYIVKVRKQRWDVDACEADGSMYFKDGEELDGESLQVVNALVDHGCLSFEEAMEALEFNERHYKWIDRVLPGVCYLTEAAAEAHAKRVNGFTYAIQAKDGGEHALLLELLFAVVGIPDVGHVPNTRNCRCIVEADND